MGKKKSKFEYNDFLEGEKLRDNTEIRTSLQPTVATSSSVNNDASAFSANRKRIGSKSDKLKGAEKSDKLPLTHFLCLPLVTPTSRPQLEKNLWRFMEEQGEEGIPRKAIRPVGTLHLTLGVMSLDAEGLEGAIKELHGLDLRSMLEKSGSGPEPGPEKESQSSPEQLTIDLQGLHPMQAAHKTSILYAEPTDKSKRLYHFGSALRDHFMEKQFMLNDKRDLRLHATIINTIYARPGGKNRRHAKSNHQHKDVSGEMSTGRQKTGGELQHQPHPQSQSWDEATPLDPSTAKEESLQKLRSEGHGPNAKSWLRFDARDMIDKYKAFTWVEDVVIDRVNVCKMGAKKITDENGEVVGEEYEVVGEKFIKT